MPILAKKRLKSLNPGILECLGSEGTFKGQRSTLPALAEIRSFAGLPALPSALFPRILRELLLLPQGKAKEGLGGLKFGIIRENPGEAALGAPWATCRLCGMEADAGFSRIVPRRSRRGLVPAGSCRDSWDGSQLSLPGEFKQRDSAMVGSTLGLEERDFPEGWDEQVNPPGLKIGNSNCREYPKGLVCSLGICSLGMIPSRAGLGKTSKCW